MWQVSISTTAAAEEAVAALLQRELGQPASIFCDVATGARQASVYPQRLPVPKLAMRRRLRAALNQLRGCGLHFGAAKISIKPLPRQNWADSWKRHFKPIDIDGVLLIKPGWSRRRPRAGQRVIILDPGLSFGTGQHPTTLFCLEQLARCRLPGEKQSFLDIGTGSGILAVAAARLGYRPVEAFDNDPVAVRVSRHNVKRNRVQQWVRPQQKDLTKLTSKQARRHDVICANLAYDLLLGQAPKLRAWLRPGGRLIVAGILRKEFPDVRKILHGFGLTLEVSKVHKNWRSGRFVLTHNGGENVAVLRQ